MATAEVAGAGADRPETERTDDTIDLEETHMQDPAEEPDIEEAEERLSGDKNDEKPEPLIEDTEEVIMEPLPEEEKPAGMVEEDEEEEEEEEEIASEEKDE